MPVREMPPLVALKAFEATARHLSATRAAAELNVTLGAVSHQLRALEEFLGADLFVRGHRQLSLTPRGAQYFEAVSGAFDALRSATNVMRHPTSKSLLKVRAYTAFSLRWLIPRLSDFYAKHKTVELVLSVSNDAVDFKRDDLDFAIRLGTGDWPGSTAERLMPNILAPVCSPGLLKGRAGIKKLGDLRRHVLLQSTPPERREDWPDWLRAQGITSFSQYNHLYFESSALTYQAAIEGHGVAMAQLALIQPELEAGRLVRPFAATLDKDPFTYYLIYPSTRRLSARMKDFRTWLMDACKSAEL